MKTSWKPSSLASRNIVSSPSALSSFLFCLHAACRACLLGGGVGAFAAAWESRPRPQKMLQFWMHCRTEVLCSYWMI